MTTLHATEPHFIRWATIFSAKTFFKGWPDWRENPGSFDLIYFLISHHLSRQNFVCKMLPWISSEIKVGKANS
jgi:hypothetical protein